MKILISDFDGTLLRGTVIDEHVKRKIIKFKEENIFIIATGRSKESLKKAYYKYNLNFFDYAICSNGSCIVNNKYKVINEQCFFHEDIKEVSSMLKKISFDMILSTKKNTFHEKSEDLAFFEDEKIYSITLTGDKASINDNYPLLQEFCKKVDINCIKNGIYIDISPKNIDKYRSYSTLKEKLNISDIKEYAIGDNENDIELLRNVDASFTFSDSSVSVKNEARFIIDNYKEIFDYVERG